MSIKLMKERKFGYIVFDASFAVFNGSVQFHHVDILCLSKTWAKDINAVTFSALF
jgi:hypothetical protein